MKLIDLTGKVFGRLTVLKRVGTSTGQAVWSCKCDCGNHNDVRSSDLRNGSTASCGCLRKELRAKPRTSHHPSLDLTGYRFGKLLVVALASHTPYQPTKWRCVCDCGNTTIASVGDLRCGDTKSCGCLRYERAKERIIDLTGKRYGRLLVIDYAGTLSHRSAWQCKCDCGKVNIITSHGLRQGTTRSCGCLALESRSGSNNWKWNSDISDADRGSRRYTGKRYIAWRAKIFTRDSYTCQCCGSGSKLTAHHKNGWGWSYDQRFMTSNGVTLCRDCHSLFHVCYGMLANTVREYNEFLLEFKIEQVA